jgi:uncharacterized protein
MMASNFLGRGWSFPVELDKNRPAQMPDVATSEADENIQQAIWIILATAPGERVMRPDFGCGIHNLVFGVNEVTAIASVVEEIRRALALWEPRIDVLSVDAESRDQGELLLINVHYRVRSTNNLFNLVFPFYLAGHTR